MLGVWTLLLTLIRACGAVEFLVIGGEYNHQSMQVFNPDDPSGSRLLETKLEGGILHHVSALTNDGKRLLIGGGQQIDPATAVPGVEDFQRSKNMWYFDMASRSVHRAVSLREVRSGAGIAELNGHLLICGGVEGKFGANSTGRCVHRSCEILPDAALAEGGSVFWQSAPGMQANRGTFVMVTLDNKVYAIGGELINTGKCALEGEKDPVLDSVEVFDPTTQSWSFTAPLKYRRFAHAAAAMGGQIYACGGHMYIEAGLGDELAPCERYDPKFRSWSVMADSVRRRANHAMLAHGDFVYVFAGSTIPNDRSGREFHDRDHSLVSVERYSLATDAWELLACHLKKPAYAATAVALPQGAPQAAAATASGAGALGLSLGAAIAALLASLAAL